MRRAPVQVRLLRLGATLVTGWGAGCGGGDPGTDPPKAPVLTVTAVTPSTSSRDVTIDLQVQGSGFERGARAVLARNGDTTFATTKIKSNSTTFQSASSMVLNITVQPGAALGRYDVMVLNPGTAKASLASVFELIISIEAIELGAGDSSAASGVNNLGQVVGTRKEDGVDRAFLWENGAIRSLGVLPGMTYSVASQINDNGIVVGGSGIGNIETASVQGAFVWSEGGGMQALATLGGSVAFAQGINELGDIVGMSATPGDKSRHAVVWRNGIITDLQPASLPLGSIGFDINDAGQVAGRYDVRGFIWSPTRGMEPLEAPGSGNVTALDNALGIDAGGRVVGWRRATGGSGRIAFLWTAGSFQDLGSTQGLEGIAHAINANGAVVGQVTVEARPVAFVWNAADGLRNLESFQGMKQAIALGINDSGWIVGLVEGPSGGTHAMLWKVK